MAIHPVFSFPLAVFENSFFSSATRIAAVKKKRYSEETKIILPYDLWMTAGLKSCGRKYREDQKKKKEKNQSGVTIW